MLFFGSHRHSPPKKRNIGRESRVCVAGGGGKGGCVTYCEGKPPVHVSNERQQTIFDKVSQGRLSEIVNSVNYENNDWPS